MERYMMGKFPIDLASPSKLAALTPEHDSVTDCFCTAKDAKIKTTDGVCA